MLGCKGASVPRCQGVKLAGCQGAKVPVCQGARCKGDEASEDESRGRSNFRAVD